MEGSDVFLVDLEGISLLKQESQWLLQGLKDGLRQILLDLCQDLGYFSGDFNESALESCSLCFFEHGKEEEVAAFLKDYGEMEGNMADDD